MKSLPESSIDLTVTSPPYDNLRTYNGFTFDFEGIAQQLYRITKPGGVVVWVIGDATVKGSETGTSFRHALYFKEIGFNLHDTMIYEKKNISFPDAIRYYNAFDYMFVFSKGKPKSFNPITKINPNAGKKIKATKRTREGNLIKDSGYLLGKVAPERSVLRNIWRYATGTASSKDKIAIKHPAIFPEQLAYDHIISWSNPGDTVLDPFAGSGTTLKMAESLGRNSIGIEISSEYCNIIHNRLNQYNQVVIDFRDVRQEDVCDRR
jgi:site-specific DNA-methyltransferase (adenine-specific)